MSPGRWASFLRNSLARCFRLLSVADDFSQASSRPAGIWIDQRALVRTAPDTDLRGAR